MNSYQLGQKRDQLDSLLEKNGFQRHPWLIKKKGVKIFVYTKDTEVINFLTEKNLVLSTKEAFISNFTSLVSEIQINPEEIK